MVIEHTIVTLLGHNLLLNCLSKEVWTECKLTITRLVVAVIELVELVWLQLCSLLFNDLILIFNDDALIDVIHVLNGHNLVIEEVIVGRFLFYLLVSKLFWWVLVELRVHTVGKWRL